MAEPAGTCPICSKPMGKGVPLFTAGCGHQFHFFCIQSVSLLCPLCRPPGPPLSAPPAAAAASALPVSQLTAPTAVPFAPPPALFRPSHAPVQLPMQPPPVPSSSAILRAPALHVQTQPMIAPPSPFAISGRPEHLADFVPGEDTLPAGTAAAHHPPRRPGSCGEIGITATLEVDEVPSGSAETVFGMVSVVSSAAPAGAAAAAVMAMTPEQRSGVDIVTVIDRSGSMQGTKMELVKSSLKYMLTQLTGRDRMCIVSFNSCSEYVCGLRRMDSAGIASVSSLIDASPHLYAQGGTAIWEGLRKGLRALQERRERNPVCTVLLLTDGQDSSALNSARGAFEGATATRIEGLSLHTFGFGSDHDAPVCSGLANLGHGTFSFVEAVDQLGPAFATALGGLLSVSAQELAVTVAPSAPGVSIVRAHTHFRATRDAAAGSVTVAISDLYSGERRDMLFEVSLPALPEPTPKPTPIASVRLSFAAAPDFDRAHPEVRETSFRILRPASLAEGPRKRSTEVEVQRLRIAGADAMSRAIALANTGKHDEAKEILAAQVATTMASASARHPVCVSLVADLNECRKRVEPKHFRSGGCAYMQSVQMQSATQRSVASPSPSAALYATPLQMQQQVCYQAYSSSALKPKPC